MERQFPIQTTEERIDLRTAKDFADRLYIHVNYLNRALKETTGKTTSEIIANRVTQEAKLLLQQTNWTVKEISYCLDYEDVAHFSNFFRKGAVEILTRYLAQELGKRRINVNVVAPGAIATDFSGGKLRDTPAIQEHIKSITAIPHIGQAEDIGGIVAFLCTPAAKWITAQRIEASGGMHL